MAMKLCTHGEVLHKTTSLQGFHSSRFAVIERRPSKSCRYYGNVHIYTSSEPRLWQASLLRRVVDGVSAKALCHQCFNESTSNVSYVDDRGNRCKVIPVATI